MTYSITLKVDIKILLLHVKRDRQFIWFVKNDSFEVFLVENLLHFFLGALRGCDQWLYPETLLLSISVFIE
jgi:hypothetical protein